MCDFCTAFGQGNREGLSLNINRGLWNKLQRHINLKIFAMDDAGGNLDPGVLGNDSSKYPHDMMVLKNNS